MVEITCRPLNGTTFPPDSRAQYENCRFKATYSQTMRDLKDELRRIGVDRAVIELEINEADLRKDGAMRASSKPHGTRIRVSFEKPGAGPLQFACDTYGDWLYNIRAVAKTLEALRAVDRYGATQGSQQYAGWAALPEASGVDADLKRDPIDVLREFAGNPMGDHSPRKLRQTAVFRNHPDHNPNAAPDAITRINAAYERIDEASRDHVPAGV